MSDSRNGRKPAPRELSPLFHTHIIVDWSARSKPSPAKRTKDAIWWAVARIDGGSVSVHRPGYARTRHTVLRRLARLIAGELDSGRRVMVGFDFPFGYPEGVAAHLTGKACALTLWDWLAARVKDQPDNTNKRYDVAAEINAAYPGCGPCWGRPGKWPYPTIPVKESERTERGRHPPERRIADRCAKGSKTVWQLAYAGSVGSQVLLGLPALKHLMEARSIAGRAAVWPFQTGLRTPEAPAVIAEVYPSLLRTQIGERRREREILDCAQVRVNAEAFARLDADGGLAPLFDGASWLTPVQRGVIETEEAWILGVGHEEALKGALPTGRP
ncbi:MAG: molybdopterin guanine dinucleotide synthesis [Deltaproteobacteria bacterium]|nr:molybdopterin guanine dinucleotide synthesis [Deltaproteobacteria bacterium]